MKLLSILFFAGGAVFLVMAFSLAVTHGVLGALDVTVFDFYFFVRPLYLLLIATALFVTGCLTFAHPIP
jgi:hypothetical protein